jgi:hypothetical protein
VNSAQWNKETTALARGALRPALELAMDKKGRTLWERVRGCGTPYIYRGENFDGDCVAVKLRPHYCDLKKICPTCSRLEAREITRALRAWLEHRREELLEELGDEDAVARMFGRLDLTQQALTYRGGRARGSAEATLKRLKASMESATKHKSTAKKMPDKEKEPLRWARWVWHQIIAGMHYGMECTINDEKGHYHAHYHCAFEMKMPPRWFIEGHTNEDDAEGAMEEWRRWAYETLAEAWRVFSPVSKGKRVAGEWVSSNSKEAHLDTYRADNVNVLACNRDNINQVTKYAVKALVDGEKLAEAAAEGRDVLTPEMARVRARLFEAMSEMHTQSRGFGGWHLWRTKVNELAQQAAMDGEGSVDETEIVAETEEDEAAANETSALYWVRCGPLRWVINRANEPPGRDHVLKEYWFHYGGGGSSTILARELLVEMEYHHRLLMAGPPEERHWYQKGYRKPKNFACWACKAPGVRTNGAKCGKCSAHHCHSCGECLCERNRDASPWVATLNR